MKKMKINMTIEGGRFKAYCLGGCMRAIEIIRKAFVEKTFICSLSSSSKSYSYLKRFPIIQEIHLTEEGITLEFHPDENGNAILPFHADLDEDITLGDQL